MFVVIFGFLETDRVNNYLLLAQDARALTGTNLRGINVKFMAIRTTILNRKPRECAGISNRCYGKETPEAFS